MLKMKINVGTYAKNQDEFEAEQLLNLLRDLRMTDSYIEIIDFELFVIPPIAMPWHTDYQTELLGLMEDNSFLPEKKANFFMKLDLKKLVENTRQAPNFLIDKIAKSGIDIELIAPLQSKTVVQGEEYTTQDFILDFIKAYINISQMKE